MLKVLGEFSVIRENQEPFGVIVKASHWEDTCFDSLYKISYGSPASRISGGGEDPFRLVQYHGNLGFQSGDKAIVYADGVLPPDHFGTGLEDNLTVYHDTALPNQLFCLTSRGDTSPC
jgi:hypothetical protein